MTDLEKALAAGGEEVADVTDAPAAPTGRPSKYPQPKSMTASDAELGLESSPMASAPPGVLARVKQGITAGPQPGQATVGNMFDVEGIGPSVEEGMAFTKKHGRPMDPMEVDTTAQTVALTTLLGPFGRYLAAEMAPTVGAIPASAGVGAGEAYLGAKSAGADNAGEAALFGGLFGGIGARGAGPNAAAVGKNNAQMVKDVKRGATKAPARLSNDVDFRADQLIDTSSNVPEVRKSLVTQARSNPGAAGGAVDKSLAKAVAENDAAYAAIQQAHGGVDLNAVTNRLASLEARFHAEGHGVASDAVGRVLDDLAERYGSNPGAKLTAEQVRNIRNDLGDIAFPGGGAKPKGARAALGSVYDEFNGAIEDIARQTPGVDVDALVARNRQISSLLPTSKALGGRVGSEADRELGVLGTVKDKVKKGATGINRRLRYGAETHGGDNPTLMGAPAAGALGASAYQLRGEIDPTDKPLPSSALAARLLMNGGVR